MADDREIWKKISHGDADAFDAFYRGNAPRLRAFLLRILGNHQAAEDVSQEAFTQMWNRPDGFQPEREPGETLQVNVAGFGTMAVTGEWMDHMPSLIADNHDLDPGPEEFRMLSPLLLRGKEVVGEFEGAMVIVDKMNQGILVYSPGQGRFELSLSPLAGAVQGSVKLNRISFEIDGESYIFLTAAPIARSEQIWILRDANFKPSGELKGANAYIGPVNLNQLAPDE